MKIRWNKKLKDKFGWITCKDCWITEKECLKRECFRPHDWNHNNHLICITNANFGCPDKYCNNYRGI